MAARYSIGEVAELLRLKPHIIRYWEQEIDLLAPVKDDSGRRTYSRADLALLYRIKHLVYARKFTVEGAGRRLLAEIEGRSANVKARIQETRDLLLELRDRLRRDRSSEPTVDSVPAALLSWVERQITMDRERPRPILRGPTPQRDAPKGIELLRRGRVAFVIRLDELAGDLKRAAYVPVTPNRRATLLQLWCEQVRRIGYTVGRTPLLALSVRAEEAEALAAHLARCGNYHLPADAVRVVPVPTFPVVGDAGRMLVDSSGRIHRYQSGLAGVLWACSRGAHSKLLSFADVMAFASVKNPFMFLGSPAFIGGAATSGLCFATFRPRGEGANRRSVRLSGNFSLSTELLRAEWERALSVNLRVNATEAETRGKQLRLERASLAGLAPAATVPLPKAARRMEEGTPRTLEELVDEFLGALAEYGARMRGDSVPRKGRRPYGEIDWIHAASPGERARRSGYSAP